MVHRRAGHLPKRSIRLPQDQLRLHRSALDQLLAIMRFTGRFLGRWNGSIHGLSVLGEKLIFEHQAETMIDGNVQLLYSVGFTCGHL